MTDQRGPDNPSIEALKEELGGIIDEVNEPEDLDVDQVKHIINRVPINEKRKEKSWTDLEQVIDKILSSGGTPSQTDMDEIYGLTDKILDRY